MRKAAILGTVIVAVASSLGVACDNDRAASTFHPTWDNWQASPANPASSTDQGAYGGGPVMKEEGPNIDSNHGMGGLPSGQTGTGTNIDGSDPAGSHGPQAPAIDPTYATDGGKSTAP
jgi:hypothetical protein